MRQVGGRADAEKTDESAVVGKKDLQQVQDHQAARRGAGDLREPQAQAAAGVRRRSKIEIRTSKLESRKQRSFDFPISSFELW
jgi:hypothetical protein